MKKLKIFMFLLIGLICFPNLVKADNQVDVYLFYSTTCSHCKAEIKYLNEIKETYNINVHLYEAIEDKDNVALLEKVRTIFKSSSLYVPFVVIGERYYIGFNLDVENKIVKAIEYYSKNDSIDVVQQAVNNDLSYVKATSTNDTTFTLPLFGTIDARMVSLPIVAIVLGLIDGFNPCAMWVLIFLITMLINMKNKKRMWILGITFLLTSALVYLLFMLAWLNVAGTLVNIIWVRLLVALIALVGGIINLKSYFKSKNAGCEVVDDKKRKKLMSSIKKFTSEKTFILALLGIITLAFSVNLIELACSAGLPLIFTQMLALNNLNGFQYMTYILLYILFFLLDDLIVFSIAMFTLNIKGISNKYSKYSHLIGGIIMVIIGILMVFKPEWLMFNF